MCQSARGACYTAPVEWRVQSARATAAALRHRHPLLQYKCTQTCVSDTQAARLLKCVMVLCPCAPLASRALCALLEVRLNTPLLNTMGTTFLPAAPQAPFTYEALPPEDIKFVPLKQTREFNAKDLMQVGALPRCVPCCALAGCNALSMCMVLVRAERGAWGGLQGHGPGQRLCWWCASALSLPHGSDPFT